MFGRVSTTDATRRRLEDAVHLLWGQRRQAGNCVGLVLLFLEVGFVFLCKRIVGSEPEAKISPVEVLLVDCGLKRFLSGKRSGLPGLILLSARVVPAASGQRTGRQRTVTNTSRERGTSQRPHFQTGIKAQVEQRAPTRSKMEIGN